MIPLITRRSSTRRAPGWFIGNRGSMAAQASSESQNPADITISLQTTGSESEETSQFNSLIGLDPRAPTILPALDPRRFGLGCRYRTTSTGMLVVVTTSAAWL